MFILVYTPAWQFGIYTSKYKKLLISKRRIGILKKLPKQGEDSESL